MPKTKVEKIVFGILMSLCMVYGMEVYNQAIIKGVLVHSGFTIGILELLGLSIIVFVIENLYGGALARRMAFRIVKPGVDREAVVIFMVQLFTICVMCPSMSLVASILFKEALQHDLRYFFAIWIQTIFINVPMAFIWQVAICGPFVRWINRMIVVPIEAKVH